MRGLVTLFIEPPSYFSPYNSNDTVSIEIIQCLMNWKGFGRKWLRPNYSTIPPFAWGTAENHKNLLEWPVSWIGFKLSMSQIQI
jgi:hypothetical protein